MAYIYDLTDTWNAGGTTFNGIKLNVTDSASAVSSKLVTLQTNGTEHFSVTKAGVGYFSGNVGIGTGAPVSKLEVLAGTVGTTAGNEVSIANQRALAGGNQVQLLTRLIRATNGTDWTTTTMRLQGRVDTSDFGYIDLISGGVQGLAFGSAGTEMMRFNSSGNVGIGTSNPLSRFTVSQSGTATISLESAGAWNAGMGVTSGGGLIFFNPLATERMRIDASGNVGIGTTPSSDRLNVSGNIQATQSGYGYLGITSGAVQGQFAANASGSLDIRAVSNHPMTFFTNNTERMRIDSSGNLLVGTTAAEGSGKVVSVSTVSANPCYAARNSAGANSYFHYFIDSGNTAIIGSISNNANTGVLYNVTSDARLKKNIANADSASSLIDALQVRKFDWKANDSHQRYGFIAQELVEVAPEAVSQPEDPDANMGVDYSKLVPMLVKEIQSMRLRLAQLEGN